MIHFVRWFQILVLQGMTVAAIDYQDLRSPPADVSFVHIEVVDVFGKTIERPVVNLASRDGKMHLVPSSGQNWDFPGVPFGEYEVRASAPGFRPSAREIEIARSTFWVTLVLELALPHSGGEPPELTGRVRPLNSANKLWAKVISVYDDILMEAPVAENGSFYFQPKRPGVYLLLILSSDRVLHIEQISLFGHKKVEVNLQDHRRDP